ncbi:1-aminocyclopropane-1-carboxylate synthase-like protein 1 [Brienomyrus brachyistius]|uniref:1-aminocyclopropane-1-carboxylate synthase-like protein 1 n=1 Tax=Brienomyrus brachyistius TaxID=42636 RepID=UPI0020B3EE1C|nr:1-aminocyclopropane-1-carboxylate synthase-like protein 1 [Brienomyrus brachyistius]
MDFRGKKYERGSNWSDPEVVELLQLWADESVQIELESCLRNQHVFNRIAEVLREKGILRTGDQCREKIKKMKLEYRRIKEHQKTMRGGRPWKFYEVMDRVLTNRPSISYSSLGGTVIAHQVLQGAAASDGFHLHGLPASAFGSQPPGSFLFGQPQKQGDPLEIKCEDADSDDCLLNSDPPPPELLYQIGSAEEADAERKSLGLEREESADMGRGDGLSPSGFSDQNMGGSSGTGWSMASYPRTGVDEEPDREAFDRERPQGRGAPRHRKRRRLGRGGAGGCSQRRDALDLSLARFLRWQREAEERLLALEEARLEREAKAEERRERLEQRRERLDRQHELRLFAIFASALTATRPGSAGPPDPFHPTNQPTWDAELPTMDPERAQHSIYLSRRGSSFRQQKSVIQEGYALYHADKHDPRQQPWGIINMGTSENKLCFDLLSKRLTQADMLHVDPALLQYPDWKGHHFLRDEVAQFLTHYCKSPRPLKADNVVVMNGCGSLFSAIAAVICDPNDAILIATPFYGMITEDVKLYSGVKLVHAHLDCEPGGSDHRPFQLSVEKLEETLGKALSEGVNVRAVILMNPHNPLGEIYSAQEMTDLLEFAKKHELHAIVDEVYMLSVFDELATFPSVLGLSRLPDAQRTHMLWGISKDFAAAGIRVGVLYSENRDMIEALDQVASFHGVPGPSQHQVAQLLRDREWISQEFLPENRARLQAAHRCMTGELQNLRLPYLHRTAGFFVWVDMRKYLREQTFQAELALWRCFLRHKVVVSCGQSYQCSTPGWFRLVFSIPEPSLRMGMERISGALRELEQSNRRSVEEQDVTDGEISAEDELQDGGSESAEHNAKGAVSVAPAGKEQPSENEGTGQEDGLSLAVENFVLMDVQAGPPPGKLDSLIDTLRQQIRSSDWLEKNTPEWSSEEDPEVLDVFKDLLDRARK